MNATSCYGEIVIHGVTILNGTAVYCGNGEYDFADTDIGVFGKIYIDEKSASFKITGTAVSIFCVGDQYEFQK